MVSVEALERREPMDQADFNSFLVSNKSMMSTISKLMPNSLMSNLVFMYCKA